MKSIWLKSFLFFCMIVSAVASFAKNYPEVEPNNSFPPHFFTSNPVFESGDTISGSINPAGDIDQFYITCFGGGLPGVYRYTFDVASGSDTYLEIFDATTGGNILGVNDDYPNRNFESVVNFDYFNPTGNNIVFGIRLRHYTSTNTIPSYSIKMLRAPVSVVDIGLLPTGNHFRYGTNLPGGVTNWYKFRLTATCDVTFDTLDSLETVDPELALMDANGNIIIANDDINRNLSIYQSRLSSHLMPGTYYLAVSRFDSSCNWNLDLNVPIGWDRGGVGFIGEVPTGNGPFTLNYHVTQTDIYPYTFTIAEGSLFSGNLASLVASDNNRLSIFPDELTLHACITFDAIEPYFHPSELKMFVETRVNRDGLAENIEMFDYANGAWFSVQAGTGPTSDTVLEVDLSGTGAYNFIGATGELRTRITWSPVNDEDPSQDGWGHEVDQMKWTVLK